MGSEDAEAAAPEVELSPLIHAGNELVYAARAATPESPPPQRKYLAMVFAGLPLFSHSYALANIFPYVGFMVVHFTGLSKEQAGYEAGLLASAFMLARIPSSLVWGFVADRIGRKPVILIACWTMVIFQLMFGLASSFPVALISRLCMGLFSGVVGTCKTIASEIAGETLQEQAWAMNFVSGATSLGVILGPSISGMLSDPATQYPKTFLGEMTLLKEFPFLLPNIVSVCFALASAIGVSLVLPETLPDPIPMRQMLWPSNKYNRLQTDDDDDDMEELDEGRRNNRNISRGSEFRLFLKTICVAYKRKAVLKACHMYAYFSFISIFFSELYPLWMLASPEAGGFEFDAKTIGMSISASAVLLLLFQVFVFPLISAKLEPVPYFRVGCLIFALYFLNLPLLRLFNFHNRNLMIIAIVLDRSIYNILNLVVFTASNQCINNSCDVHERGTVNGLTMGVGSIYKALGPVCAGSLFAWSINNSLGFFPFNFSLSFIVLSLLCFLLALYSYTSPPELNSLHDRKP